MNFHNFKKYLQVNYKENFKYLLYFFGQESTIHGIRYFVDGENFFHRVVWMVLVGCSVAYLSYLVRNAFMYVICNISKENIKKIKGSKIPGKNYLKLRTGQNKA